MGLVCTDSLQTKWEKWFSFSCSGLKAVNFEIKLTSPLIALRSSISWKKRRYSGICKPLCKALTNTDAAYKVRRTLWWSVLHHLAITILPQLTRFPGSDHCQHYQGEPLGINATSTLQPTHHRSTSTVFLSTHRRPTFATHCLEYFGFPRAALYDIFSEIEPQLSLNCL